MNYENLKDIAEGLIALKYDVIIVNIVVVFLGIVAVYFLSRINKSAELKEINDNFKTALKQHKELKSAELKEINNNFETVLKQQKELALETGKINQLLDKESINYQIRLNAYHDKSIEAVNDIYVAIVDLREAAKVLTFKQDEEEKKKFVQTISEFRSTFDTRKIWIDSDLSSHIEKVAIEIDSRAGRFILANTRAERMERLSEERMNKIFDEQDQFYDYIHQEIAVVFDKLVKQISSTIRADMA